MKLGVPRWPATIGALALCLILPAAVCAAAPPRAAESPDPARSVQGLATPPRAPESPDPARPAADPATPARRPATRLGGATPVSASAVSHSVAITVQVIPSRGLPPSFSTWLGVAGPNPFSTATIIRYSCAVPGDLAIKVFSVQGQMIAKLVERYHQAGTYSLWWDGRDGDGRLVAPGIYFCRMQQGRRSITNKLVYLP